MGFNVCANINFHVFALRLDGSHALLGFSLVMLVRKLRAEEFDELGAGNFFVVETVVEVLIDHLDFVQIELCLMLSRVLDRSCQLLC